MSGRHPIFNNTIFNIINTGFSFIIAYIMTPIIINRMGIDQYGIWVFLSIFTITGYASLLDLGFQGAAVKYVSEFITKKDFKKLSQTITTTITFFFTVGVITTLLLVIFNILLLERSFSLPENSYTLIKTLVTIIAASLIIQFPTIGFSAILQGLQRYDYLRIGTIGSTLITNLLILIFLNNQNGLYLLVYLSVLSAILLIIYYRWAIKKIIPQITLRIRYVKSESFKLLFGMSWKLFLSKIVGLIFKNTDKILIAIFLSVAVQTSYDIINKIYLGLMAILSMINQAIIPVTSEFNAENKKDKLQMLLLRATKYASAAALPTIIFLFLFPSELISAWINPEFSYLGSDLRLYVSHVILTMLVSVGSTMLIGVDRILEGLKISLVAAGINLITSIIAVQQFGITGLILGTVVGYTYSSLAYIFLFKKIFYTKLGIFFKEIIYSQIIPIIFLSGGLIILKIIATPSNLLLLVIIFFLGYIIYFTLFYRFSLHSDEKNLAKNITTQLKEKITSLFTN